MTILRPLPELKSCPFCGSAVQFCKALFPSAVIHATPVDCGLVQFDVGTTDEQVIVAWNTRHSDVIVPDAIVSEIDASEADLLRASLATANARIAAMERALREAWHVARDGALVPPDGGSPTEEENALCNHIADGIQAIIDREARAAAKEVIDE